MPSEGTKKQNSHLVVEKFTMRLLILSFVLLFVLPRASSAQAKFFHSYAGLTSSSLALWAAKEGMVATRSTS